MATHSSTLAWKIPWTEEPGRLQSKGLQSWTRLSNFIHTHTHTQNKKTKQKKKPKNHGAFGQGKVTLKLFLAGSTEELKRGVMSLWQDGRVTAGPHLGWIWLIHCSLFT